MVKKSIFQPLFLAKLSVGPSIRKSSTTSIDNDIGFSVKYEDVIIGLDTLTVNDKTLWMTKITKAVETFSVTEKHFLTRQKSGLF